MNPDGSGQTRLTVTGGDLSEQQRRGRFRARLVAGCGQDRLHQPTRDGFNYEISM